MISLFWNSLLHALSYLLPTASTAARSISVSFFILSSFTLSLSYFLNIHIPYYHTTINRCGCLEIYLSLVIAFQEHGISYTIYCTLLLYDNKLYFSRHYSILEYFLYLLLLFPKPEFLSVPGNPNLLVSCRQHTLQTVEIFQMRTKFIFPVHRIHLSLLIPSIKKIPLQSRNVCSATDQILSISTSLQEKRARTGISVY